SSSRSVSYRSSRKMARLRMPVGWRDALLWSDRHSFLHDIIRVRFVITVAMLVGLSNLVGHLFLLQYPSQLTLDSFARNVPVRKARFCSIIRIGSVEYEQFFRAKSPIPFDRLNTAIMRVLALRPAVLGIDLDTSGKDFSAMKIPGAKTPVVWARDASTEGG